MKNTMAMIALGTLLSIPAPKLFAMQEEAVVAYGADAVRTVCQTSKLESALPNTSLTPDLAVKELETAIRRSSSRSSLSPQVYRNLVMLALVLLAFDSAQAAGGTDGQAMAIRPVPVSEVLNALFLGASIGIPLSGLVHLFQTIDQLPGMDKLSVLLTSVGGLVGMHGLIGLLYYVQLMHRQHKPIAEIALAVGGVGMSWAGAKVAQGYPNAHAIGLISWF